MWELLDAPSDTRGTEIPGLGCIVGVPGFGLTFVPGARLKPTTGIEPATHIITRDDRQAPPLRSSNPDKVTGLPDPGAAAYIVQHEFD